MNKCEGFGRVYEMDGARHCYRCKTTWHEHDGVWEPAPVECVEYVSAEGKAIRKRILLAKAEVMEEVGNILDQSWYDAKDAKVIALFAERAAEYRKEAEK